jgi:uncharacterized protein YrrD
MKAGIELLGQNVVDVTSGRSLGSVADLLFDDDGSRVTGLVIERRWLPRRTVVPFEEIYMFRHDGIVAAARRQRRQRATSDSANAGALEGKPIVSATGRLVGTVRDVYFDEATGRVVAYEVSNCAPRRICRRRSLVYLHREPIVGDVIILARGAAHVRNDDRLTGERRPFH